MSIQTRALKVDKPNYIGGGSWSLNKLTPITIIFGKNGSGKSILLRKIRDLDPKSYHYCVSERGGNISFDASMHPMKQVGHNEHLALIKILEQNTVVE